MWMLFCCYERPHQILSCLPLLYIILAVFVDSFEMSMIVVDDKSIFLNFIIQIHLTNVSGIIYHGLLKYMACYFGFRQKIIFQYKNFSHTVSRAKGISKKLCLEYSLAQKRNLILICCV